MAFRPLHDRVLVRRIEADEKTAGGIIIPDTAKEKPQEGEIVAVGNGTKAEDGKVTPLAVKAGDKVLSETQASTIDASSTMQCANCGTVVQGSQIVICSSKHPVCASCAMKCQVCGREICLKCITSKCSSCGRMICVHCHTKCRSCQVDLCLEHTAKCHICASPGCDDCTVTCAACGKPTCLEHIRQVPGTDEYRCSGCSA